MSTSNISLSVSSPIQAPAAAAIRQDRLSRHRRGLDGSPALRLAGGLVLLALAGCGGGGAGAPAPSASAPPPAETPSTPAPAPIAGTSAPGAGQAPDAVLVREAQTQTATFVADTEKLLSQAGAGSGRAVFLGYQLKAARVVQAELQAPTNQAQVLASAAQIAAMPLDTQLWLEAERRILGQAVWTSQDLAAVAAVVRRFDVWGIAQLPAASETREFSVGEVSSMSAALRMAAESVRQGKVDPATLRAALSALRVAPLAEPVAYVAPPVVDKPPLRIVSTVPSMNAVSDAPHPSSNIIVNPPAPAPSPGTPSTPGAPSVVTQIDSVRVSVTQKPAEVTFAPGTPAYSDKTVVAVAGLLTASDISTISSAIDGWRLTPGTTCPGSFVSGELPSLPYDWRISNGAASHTMDMISGQYVAGVNPTSSNRTMTNFAQAGYPFQSFVNVVIVGPADVVSFLDSLRNNRTTCSQVVDGSLETFGVDSRANSDGRRYWTFTLGRSWTAPAL